MGFPHTPFLTVITNSTTLSTGRKALHESLSPIYFALPATDEQFVLPISHLFRPYPHSHAAFLVLVICQIIPDIGGQNILRLTAAPNGRVPCTGSRRVQYQPNTYGVVLGVGQPVVYIKVFLLRLGRRRFLPRPSRPTPRRCGWTISRRLGRTASRGIGCPAPRGASLRRRTHSTLLRRSRPRRSLCVSRRGARVRFRRSVLLGRCVFLRAGICLRSRSGGRVLFHIRGSLHTVLRPAARRFLLSSAAHKQHH